MSAQKSGTAPSADEMRQERRSEFHSYIWGYVFALGLTLAAFAPVALPNLATRTDALWTVGILAAVQIVVHLRFFLHIDLSRQKREDLHLILFSTLLLALMAGGTLWIIFNLYGRM